MTGAGSSTISPMTRRRPRRVIGVLAAGIAAELIAGLVGVALVSTGNTGHHPTPAPQARAVAGAGRTATASRVGRRSGERRAKAGALAGAGRLQAVRVLLARRAEALLHHDRAGFLDGIDPHSPGLRAAQGRLFNDLAHVPLAAWSYSVDGRHGHPAPAGRDWRDGVDTWSPDVTLSYRLAGFDTRPVTEQLYPAFVRRGGRWYLAAQSRTSRRGGSPPDLWDFGPVVVLRAGNVLVLGHPGARATMREIAAVVRRAIPRVTAVWGMAWPRRVVVLVPSTQRELTAIVDDGSDLAQIAAVATAELAGPGAPAGERVIVSPRNFAKLGALGRRVVLTHEITHIAARAVTSESTPEWLAEGFADYVGYRGTGVATRFAAAELAADLHRGATLAHLPTPSQFAGGNVRLADIYERSWLACRLLARDLGQRGLVSFYRSVSARGGPPGPALDAVLRQRLGMSTTAFTRSWRRYVIEQLQ